MLGINIWASLVAAASSFLLGGLWYSPALFGPSWNAAEGRSGNPKPGHPARVFGVSFILAVIAATSFAWLVGPKPPLGFALYRGMGAGMGMVAASFGINYSFAGRSPTLWLIDAGYHALQFTIFGLILGLWH